MQQRFAMLPLERVAAVEKALLATFNTTDLDTVTPLTAGLSTALVYKLVVKGKAYVLRVILHIDPLSDPVRQFECMRLAAAAGIAPRVYYADADDALSITQFIDKMPILEHFTDFDELLGLLARLVKAIHATPPFPELVNFLDGVDGFITAFKASKKLPVEATAEHFRYYAAIQEYYPRHDPDRVSSHNDLNYNNLLFDGAKIWIIDWEAAFLNDRYVDLANLANGFISSEEEEEIYLRAYFGDALDDTKRARFFLMRQVCHFYYAMIMFHLVAGQIPAGQMHDANMDTPPYAEFRKLVGSGVVQLGSYEGQLLFAKVALNESLHHMQSQRFANAIQLVSQGAPPN